MKLKSLHTSNIKVLIKIIVSSDYLYTLSSPRFYIIGNKLSSKVYMDIKKIILLFSVNFRKDDQGCYATSQDLRKMTEVRSLACVFLEPDEKIDAQHHKSYK